jgi:tryptophanyl-tRNA synthetase
LIEAHFEVARKRKQELLDDAGKLRRILKNGAEKARVQAIPTLEKVRERIGCIY